MAPMLEQWEMQRCTNSYSIRVAQSSNARDECKRVLFASLQ